MKELANSIAEKIASGEWQFLAVAGGPSLKPAEKFLRGFDIVATDKVVVIVCERSK